MTTRRAYSFTVLRYVHDVTTGEFVNVGLVLYTPFDAVLRVKPLHTMGRIKDIFPDLDRRAFVAAMKSVEKGVAAVAADLASGVLLREDGDAGAFARRAVPLDYSSLQWSPVGAGLTDDAEKTFTRLYERFVSRYDLHSQHRKSDDEVWRPVRDLLAERGVEVALARKEIVGDADTISFDHAWKNRVWHAYEPLSMDLVDADGIKDKARRWLGHLSAVADGSSDSFKVYFILGKPQTPALMPAYENAKAILAKAPGGPAIYEEDQIDGLVTAIEDEYRAHVASAR